jgi:hypothetical protein
MLLKKYLLYYTNMYRTTIIYRLYSPALNKSFISYTTNMKRVVFNLKSYLKTGRANRSKSREIIAQGDYKITVLQKYEGVPHNHIMTEINRFKTEEDPDILENKMVYGKTENEKRTYCREMYHKTGAQLGYYYANCEKINRGNLLKRMKKNGVVPKKETLQKYNITQEEIDECISKK